MSSPTFLLCATEISGDVRGARLAAELRRLAPDLHLRGLGGERMRQAGVDVQIDITDRGTVGFFDHWRDMPHYLGALAFWRREIRTQRPVAAIVIDAPGISFPLARLARALGIPVVYFVTPQTWLWNPEGAIERLRAHADIVVPTLEAEADIYTGAGLPVVYEGHPAVDDLVETYGPAVKIGVDDGGGARVRAESAQPAGDLQAGVTVGIAPGSRRHAVARLLPVMLDAVDLLRQRIAVRETIVSVASAALRPEVCRRVQRAHVGNVRTCGDLRNVLAASDVVLASTGGNLLEVVFAQVPVVACYRVDALTNIGARHLLRLHQRLPAFSLPNLIAGRQIVPELIQKEFTAKNLAAHAERLLTDVEMRKAMCEGYSVVRGRLGRPGVNARIARAILSRLVP